VNVATVVENYRASAAAAPSRFAPEHFAKGPPAAAIAKRARARAAYSVVAGFMKALRAEGLTFAAIADALNAEGNRTRYGSRWDASNVLRVIRLHAD
jgi:hypothetical protein